MRWFIYYSSQSFVTWITPASILYKSIAVRYRPVSYPDGPITARYRFIKKMLTGTYLIIRTNTVFVVLFCFLLLFLYQMVGALSRRHPILGILVFVSLSISVLIEKIWQWICLTDSAKIDKCVLQVIHIALPENWQKTSLKMCHRISLLPSGYITLKQHRFNVHSTSWRCFNIVCLLGGYLWYRYCVLGDR